MDKSINFESYTVRFIGGVALVRQRRLLPECVRLLVDRPFIRKLCMWDQFLTVVSVAVVLGSVILLPIVWLLVSWQRCPYSLWEWLVYLANAAVTRGLWRAEIEGRLLIGPRDGAVIVCNHSCLVDPSFIQLVTGRVAHWFVAREYYEFPLIAWYFRVSQAIPVNRAGIDTAAIKTAIRYVQEGEIVGILPEGRINETSQVLLPGRPGAALIAIKGRVPVIPCFVKGAPYDGTLWGCFLMSAHVHLKIGDPIDLSEFHDHQGEPGVLVEATKRIMREMAALAGAKDFEPEIAGRHWSPVQLNNVET